MTKNDLIGLMAGKAGISKVQAGKALTVLLEGVKGAMKRGQRTTLVGFGTFGVSNRKARTGRNPRTGQEIKIPAMRVPKFTPGQALKAAVRK